MGGLRPVTGGPGRRVGCPLAQLAATWTGAASERAISAITPAVLWMRTTSLQAHKRALQAAAQATAHATALAETPPIPEIEENHVTHAVLEATNFLGINTVPIGLNEEDYFVRMWNQAAAAMDAYHAETLLNTTFEPVPPLPPIVIPGVAEAVGAAGVAAAAAMAPVPRHGRPPSLTLPPRRRRSRPHCRWAGSPPLRTRLLPWARTRRSGPAKPPRTAAPPSSPRINSGNRACR